MGESTPVTLYGIDVASYQAGLNLAEVKAESFDFIIAKPPRAAATSTHLGPRFVTALTLTTSSWSLTTTSPSTRPPRRLKTWSVHSGIPAFR